MSVKQIEQNPFVFLICLIILCLFRESLYFTALIFSLWLFYSRSHQISVLIILCAVIIWIPRWNSQMPSMTQGRAVKVSSSYAIFENGRERLLVYTNEDIVIDGVYEFHGEMEELESSSGFYRFDFSSYCHPKGVYYSMNGSLSLVKENHTIRRWIQKRIEMTEDEQMKTYLRYVFFNQKSDFPFSTDACIIVIPTHMFNDQKR